MKGAYNGADLIGTIFHRLTVIRRAANSNAGQRRWECLCSCGNVVVASTTKLRSGRTKSCGCLSRDRTTKHGMHNTTEYLVWQQMKERCHNPKKAAYLRYGARGIEVCARWRESFQAFIDDMGPRPAGTTLDRIDNNGPYAPENCRWADNHTQYTNRRQTVWVEYDGERKCRKGWARQYGVNSTTLAQRLSKGWDIHRALTTPPMNSGGGKRQRGA